MGRALICGMHGQTLASGFSWVLGGIFRGATEAQSQASATEQADFTALRGSVQSGGSGTNTFQFRNAGANGNNVASCVGATAFEDATPHTDTVAAGALFNGGYTDTGTDTVSGPIAMNVTLAAGHGNFHFHAAAGATTYAIASATRYFGIHGATTNNGQTAANIAKCQFKNREYTSLEAFQIRITANARLNDSVLSVNINGVDVGTPITFATLTTGLQSVTGMGVALAPGDLVCISLTSGAGVDTLSFSFFGVTLKSTGLSSMGGLGSQNGTTRAASATPLYLSFGNNTNATEANCAVRVGFAARCANLRVYVAANTYTADATLKLFVNGVARLTTTITAGAQNQWFENATDTFDITATDTVSFEIVGGSSGSITTHQLWIGFNPIPVPPVVVGLPPGGDGWYPPQQRRIKRSKPERSLRQMFEPVPRSAEAPLPAPVAHVATTQPIVTRETFAPDPTPLIEGLASLRSLAEAQAIAQAVEGDDAEVLMVAS